MLAKERHQTATGPYNRRTSAANVSLWPLPRYHGIGDRHFARRKSLDSVPFVDKLDQVVWRGNLTGRANLQFPDRGPIGRSSSVILREMVGLSESDSEVEKLVEELRGITRFRVMKRHWQSNDYNLAFTLSPKFASLMRRPIIGMHCGEVKPKKWFHQFKYALCLSGHDTGSNFFDIACSKSLMLKEEDGWELFYTASFRPWEHYIPLSAGAVDLPEKLEWARSNQRECERISTACQTIARKFADKVLRIEILNGILDQYWRV